MKTRICFPLAFLFLALSCSDNTATSVSEASDSTVVSGAQISADAIDESKTKQVLDHHWQAFTKNDLEEVMADYTEESVLITPDATYKGLEQIRKNFENAYKKFPKDSTDFKLNKEVIDRDVAYILWQAKTPTFDLTYGTDTFIIRNGKIIRQTYAGVAKAL